ncbi:MAG: YceD family protein [Actinomycetota bacterium]
MNSKAQSAFRVNLHELPRRAGEMRTYELNFPAPEPIGIPLLEIRRDEPVDIAFRAESVDDGVLITGEVSSVARGECGRCLEPIEQEIDQKFQELFLYENRLPQDSDDDDLFCLDGDVADIEIAIRDAVILSMPINPVCADDCEGLCATCGEKWAVLPEDHTHEVVDPRWTGLAGWKPE